MTAGVKIDSASLAQAKLMLIGVEKGFPKAYARAMNTSAKGVRTDMVTLARTEYNYKATAVRQRTKITSATYSRLMASVKSSGGGVHLTEMLGTRQTLRGISVDVKKSTGRKLITSAFKSTGHFNASNVIYIRERQGGVRVPRKPTDALYAPHPEVVYNTGENWAGIQNKAQDRLDKAFAHEVDAVLKGF